MAINPEFQTTVSAYFADLRNLIEEFNFTRPGKDHVLGKDIAHVVANGIVDRSVQKQGGADAQWPANSAKYTTDKFAKYKVALIGFRTGQMISLPSLLAQIDVEPLRVTMRYGTNEPPTRSMSGYIEEEDKKVTDTQKADWFTKKKGNFYEPDEDIRDKVIEHFANALDQYIDELNHQS